MLFNSVSFLIFFPIVVLIYFFIPQRVKYLWLLGASYFFYMSWNPRYALLILASTVTTWGSALLLSKCGKWFTRHPQRAEKWCLAGCAALNLGILFFFKYYVFAAENMEGSYDYSLEQGELTLTEREYGDQMVFEKE